MDIFTKLIVFLRIDKIIDSIKSYKKENRKRRDLEKIRSKKQVANAARTFNHKFLADYYDREAKIIEDSKED